MSFKLIQDQYLIENDCWIWTGRLNNKTPVAKIQDGVWRNPSRLFYEYYIGSLPSKFRIDRSCKNVLCMNYEHFILLNLDNKLPYIEDENGCWIFQGSLTAKGYGRLRYESKKWQAHRLSYFLNIGNIPDNMCVCHTCDVRNCINPDHLWLGTHDDNMHDMNNKGRNAQSLKTRCVNGHPFNYVSTMYKGNRRICLICKKNKQDKDSQKRRERNAR